MERKITFYQTHFINATIEKIALENPSVDIFLESPAGLKKVFAKDGLVMEKTISARPIYEFIYANTKKLTNEMILIIINPAEYFISHIATDRTLSKLKIKEIVIVNPAPLVPIFPVEHRNALDVLIDHPRLEQIPPIAGLIVDNDKKAIFINPQYVYSLKYSKRGLFYTYLQDAYSYARAKEYDLILPEEIEKELIKIKIRLS